MLKNRYYKRIRKLTKNSRKAQFAKRPHAAVIKALADADYPSLTSNCAAHIAAYIEDALFGISNRDGTWLGKAGNRTLDEARYKREVRILHRLSERLQYSGRLQDWMTRNSLAFADHLRQDMRFSTRLSNWSTLTLRQREVLLKSFIAAQAGFFSQTGLTLCSPQVEIIQLSGQVGAACETPSISKVKSATELRIKIDPLLLKRRSARLPLSVAFHEGIHGISWQLALATRQGGIKPGHALYRDAELRKCCLNQGSMFPWQISSIYPASAEEKLAYGQENAFNERFFSKRPNPTA